MTKRISLVYYSGCDFLLVASRKNPRFFLGFFCEIIFLNGKIYLYL